GNTPTARSVGTCEADNKVAGETMERFGLNAGLRRLRRASAFDDEVLHRMRRAASAEKRIADLCGSGGGDFGCRRFGPGGLRSQAGSRKEAGFALSWTDFFRRPVRSA